ncbi:hypothetical protein GCM10023189_43280 [Nibrella saemangeumensis]|uniref:Phage terminase large subunit N-terminal domain-containing protein n=1 Tax=Nibrella saemangeumensis TaxID=1084526 RepID=A0ABP8NCS6_9BACT
MSRPRKREQVTASRNAGPSRQKTLAAPTIDVSLVKSQLLRVYHELKRANTPYVINYGGGGSGKSHGTVQYLVRRLLSKREKMLVLRKYATSLQDSVIDLFKEIGMPFFALKEGIDYTYSTVRKRIEFANGSVVIFRGLDDPEKMKSITGITIVWIEEATELEPDEFKILSDRIRGEPQIFLTYNPISERHWLKARFHDKPDPRVSIIFSTYLDNPFVGQKFRDDMEWYRVNDYDHYRIYGLGEWGVIRPENPYFTAWKPSLYVGTCHYNPAHPLYISADFNVKNSFLFSQHYSPNAIHYFDCWHGTHLTNTEGPQPKTMDLEELCKQIAQRYKHNLIYWTGDASGNNRSAYTTGNMSAWELIQMYMIKYGAVFCNYDRVPKSNPSTAAGRHVSNALMTYYGKRMVIDRQNCGLLIDDIERMQATADGSLDKVDANKQNYGHVGDCLRYDHYHFEYHTYQMIGVIKKAA